MSLAARLDRLEAARSTGPQQLVWCDEGTDPEQAIRAHLHRCPADTGRTLTLIGWAEPDSPQNWPMPPASRAPSVADPTTRREPPDFDVPARRTCEAPPMPTREELAGRKAKEQDSTTTFQGEGHA